MRRPGRFEVVRSDAGWFSRVRGANGRKVWQSEVYTREVAALNAFRVLGDLLACGGAARVIGGREGRLAGYLHVPTREDDTTVAWLAIPIYGRDERTRP